MTPLHRETSIFSSSVSFHACLDLLNVLVFPYSSNTCMCVKSLQSCSTLCALWTAACQSPLSVQFTHSVVSESLRPHESQHARPPCPSPTPGVHSDSRPLSQWCHPAVSPSVVPFSSCPQSLPVSKSFPMSQLFVWGGQSTGVLASASSSPEKSQGWSPSEWTDKCMAKTTTICKVISLN